MIEVRAARDEAEARRALGAISHYFGTGPDPKWWDRILPLSAPDRFHVALDDDVLAGSAGAFPLELSVPGGASVPTCGTTTVGVLPTHRRRGILRQLMRAQLDDAVERGEPLAALWASEAAIYGRFGFGLAALSGEIDLERAYAALRPDAQADATVRLVTRDEAQELVPPVYEEVRRQVPGMPARPPEWWEVRILADPEDRRGGGGELTYAVVELGGRVAGYALYRVNANFEHGSSVGHIGVKEAMGTTPEAKRALWSYLLGIDWMRRLEAYHLPLDHELFLLLTEPRRLRFRLGDALWLRLLDVGAALAARSYAGDGRLVLEVRDEFLPANEGRWLLSGERTDGEPDLRLDAADLASPYLGGFTFAQLREAGRVEELADGGVDRADGFFRTDRAPWCPEIF
jgi:predicted acetyltransferase